MIKSLVKKISCATLVLLVLGTFFVVNISAEEDSPHIDGFDYFNYYQLEYVLTNGGVYDTGLMLSDIDSFSLSYTLNTNRDYQSAFGCSNGGDTSSYFALSTPALYPNALFICRRYYELNIDYSNILVSYSRNSFSINDIVITDFVIPSDYNSFSFFARHSGPNSYNGLSNLKVNYFTLNNKFYVPAQNISTLEVGFYCITDGTFIKSSTSTQFVAGPIISPNVSYGININCIQSNHYVGSFDIPANTIQYNCYTDYQQYLSSAYASNDNRVYVYENNSGGWNGYYINASGLRLDLHGSIKGYSTDVGTINIPKMTIDTSSDIDIIYEFEVVFDRSYLGSYKVTYSDGTSTLDRTVYVNGVKSTFNIVGDYYNVSLSNFNFVPNDPNTTMNVGSYESNSAAQSTNESFVSTSSSFDSLEAGQLEQTQTSLNNINTNFSFGGNSKFLKSAQFVKTQFDYHFSNNEFGSLLIFSLTVGLVMLLIGKVMK